MEFEQQVNQAIEGATKNDEGKTVFPEGTPEAISFAANAELRRRDTQSAFTKEQQKVELLAKENEKLLQAWSEEVGSTLTDVQKAELEELKNTDVDAWRKKLNTFEIANKAALKTKQQKITSSAKAETEIQRRTALLNEHNKANPNAQITDDTLKNDVPPRIVKKLTSGEITFEQFLTEAKTYITTPKVVGQKTTQPPGGPDLSDLGGDNKPTTTAITQDILASYSKEIY